MADFEKAYRKVIAHEGTQAHHEDKSGKPEENVLCSNCFRDEGLRLDAFLIGIEDGRKCTNCSSDTGRKLNKEIIQKLCYRFFVRGTIERFDYGGCPLIQFNEQHFRRTEIDISPWLNNDVKLIEEAGQIGLFYYGPRFWMLGEVEPLVALQNNTERDQIINRILQSYPTRELSEKEYFYRLRRNPGRRHDFSEYDTPPDTFLGTNRFDEPNLPVLYGSSDLELCIHECRVTVEDNLFVGKLVPAQTLKLLDLSVLIEESATEFESLDIAIHFLFLAGEHSYGICRQIAYEAKKRGYDGIIYPSYFSYIRTGAIPFETVYGISIRRIPELKSYAQSQSIPNIALFGRPVKEKKVTVDCINKVIINKVSYETTFGPAYHQSYSSE